MSNVLGFDFGTKYIGVAVGEFQTKATRELTSIKRKNRKYDWQRIESLVDEFKPEVLVVGRPLTKDGKEQELSILAAKFANQLRGRFKLKVYEEDERLTSMEAQSIISRMNYKGDKKELVDKIAARLILQSWMNNAEA